MMKRILVVNLFLVFILCITSCVSSKKYAELQDKQKETQDKINEVTESLNKELYRNEKLNSLITNLEWEIEELKETSQNSGYVEDMDNYAFSYFYSLKSSEELYISNVFDLGTPLLATSQKIVSEIHKMGYDENDYKYFYIDNGYGIVTDPIPVTPEGKRGDKGSDCNWFNFLFCSGKSYYRMYIFLVVSKQPSMDREVTMEDINNYYNKNINLDANWNSLDSLESLFYGEKNKFNEKYSFFIRVYDFLSEDFGDGSKLLKETKFEPFKESGYVPFKN